MPSAGLKANPSCPEAADEVAELLHGSKAFAIHGASDLGIEHTENRGQRKTEGGEVAIEDELVVEEAAVAAGSEDRPELTVRTGRLGEVLPLGFRRELGVEEAVVKVGVDSHAPLHSERRRLAEHPDPAEPMLPGESTRVSPRVRESLGVAGEALLPFSDPRRQLLRDPNSSRDHPGLALHWLCLVGRETRPAPVWEPPLHVGVARPESASCSASMKR